MTPRNPKRDEAIAVANLVLARMNGLSDLATERLIRSLAYALLAEVEAHERIKQDYQCAMRCCEELAAARAKIAEIEEYKWKYEALCK